MSSYVDAEMTDEGACSNHEIVAGPHWRSPGSYVGFSSALYRLFILFIRSSPFLA
jgi:hypothetical protein